MQEEMTLTIEEFFDLSQAGGLYEIKTPDGWVDLGDLIKKKKIECYKIKTENGKTLGGSKDHYVETNNGWVSLEELTDDTIVLTDQGYSPVVKKEKLGIKDTYDFEVLHQNHRYYSNGISSHNTGKTATARAMGQELNMPIFVFDLATMTNQDFNENWHMMMNDSPCFALLEDIDGVFEGRKNIASDGKMNQGLTFDSLLNTLDGVENTDGVFLLVTSNHLDKIDPALGNPYNGDDNEISTRPGRINRIIEFKHLDEAGRIKMAERIFKGFDRSCWEHLLSNEKDTGAQFQERCCHLAMKLWKDKTENQILGQGEIS